MALTEDLGAVRAVELNGAGDLGGLQHEKKSQYRGEGEQ
jgi:hypothetical protein